MTEISLEELMTLLNGSCPAVHCDASRNYRKWYADEDGTAKFYFTDGCAVLYDAHVQDADPEQYWISCHIHEVSDDCDFAEACRKFKEMSDAAISGYARHSRFLSLFHCGPLSDQLNEFFGFRKFTRRGEAFPADPHVHKLTREHADELRTLCDPAVLETDTWFGKCEAETFYDWDFDWYEQDGVHLLGYREENGTLLGVTSWSSEDECHLGFLRDLFVAPDGRGKGIGKALVRTAMANLPDREWLYQAARDNAPSIGLAKSLGFTLAGAELYVLSE
ncbi:MAG: GNAT family N-acetyltransferase [Eubacteriales bacterium]